MIIKSLFKTISVLLIVSILITFCGMIIIIKNGNISFMIEHMRGLFVFTVVGWLIIYIIGPYASFNLWRTNNKGRKATLIILVFSISYYCYTMYYYPPPYFMGLLIWIILIANILGSLVLLSPGARKACLPNKEYSASWFFQLMGRLKATEKLTICISVLALIVSIANVFFYNFYKPDKLLASVSDIQISNDSMCFPVTFINNGRVHAIVNSFNIAFTRKDFIIRSFWGDGNTWYWQKNIHQAPEGEFPLKPGEMRLAKISIPSIITNEILTANCEELLVSLVTRTVDSKGVTHLKHNQLGKVLLNNGRVVKLYGKAGEFVLDDKGGSVHHIVNDTYESVFRLH